MCYFKKVIVCMTQGKLDFNPPTGHVTVSRKDVEKMYLELCIEFAKISFGKGYTMSTQ